MLKTKYALSALGLLVAMTMAADALAQASFTVGSGSRRVRLNGQAEMVGSISMRIPSGSGTVTEESTVSIDYGAPITNTLTTTGEKNISATVCGVTGTTGATGNVTIDHADGVITLTVAANAGGCNDGIHVSGVRLAIAGSGHTSIVATISSTDHVQLGANANQVIVGSTVVDELTDAGVTTKPGRTDTKLTLIRHTGIPMGGTADTQFHLVITENALDSFDEAQLNLEFDGVPPGATLTLDAWVAAATADPKLNPIRLDGDDADTADVTEAITGNDQVGFFTGDDTAPSELAEITAEDNEAIVLMYLLELLDEDNDETDVDETTTDYTDLDGMTDPKVKDKVVIRGNIEFDSGPTAKSEFPLDDVEIMVTIDVGPTGRAFEGLQNTVKGTSTIPRFASDPTSPVTVIDVTSDKTTLTAPYALATMGFDTGFAISNMNTKSEQAGAITFMLYQDGDDPIEYTTSAGSPGRGLTNGELAAGTTYAVLLTEILDAAGVEGGFSGYAMIITDFTDADGIAYISDWAAFSATATLK